MTAQLLSTAATPAPLSNAMKLSDVLLIAADFGKLDADTKDGQIKFDLKILEAASQGAIDFVKNKHGTGVDDSMMLAKAYAEGRNKAVIFDPKAPNQRKLASTFRLVARLGASPKYGVGEPWTTVNTLITIRQNLLKTPNKTQRLDDMHNTLMRYARKQLDRDTLITGEELKSFCFKPGTDPTTTVDVIKSIQKQALRLTKGKNPVLSDSSAEIQGIVKLCNERLAAIAKADAPSA